MAARPREDFARLGRFYGWDVDAAGALSIRPRKVFMCWGQESIVASTMQALRGHEARDSSPTSIGDWTSCEIRVTSDLLARLGAYVGDRPTSSRIETVDICMKDILRSWACAADARTTA